MSQVSCLNTSSSKPLTLAVQATGYQNLLGPLSLLVLWLLPVCWIVPLFETETLFFLRNEVSILVGVQSLYEIDSFLCFVVVLFSIVAPTAKALLALWCWYRCPAARLGPLLAVLAILGKLSMAEVFLIAVALIAFKGIGLGEVHVAWGLYLYVVVILFTVIQSVAFWWVNWRQNNAGR